MERCYKVTFDTQRNRQYTSWAYYTIANNQKEARQKAEQAWDNLTYNGWYRRTENKPHMFHVCAERYNTNGTDEDTRVCNHFYIERSRYANWG